MVKRKSPQDLLFEIVNVLLLTCIAAVMLYPFWHELCISFSSSTQATRGGVFLLPREPTMEAYGVVTRNPFIWTSYVNSFYCVVFTTALGTLVTAMLSYPLSKKKMAGNRMFSFIVVFCMIFNGGIIPTYLVVSGMGLIDNLWALVLPFFITPYNAIIMKNFFESLPEELEEAAYIDGAGPLRIFFTIILPLSKAVMATVALWLAVASWNNFQGPLIYINSRENFTLPLFVRQVIDGQMMSRLVGEGAQAAVESVVGATIIITVLPIICVYPFLQKYFVKGVLIGSVKG